MRQVKFILAVILGVVLITLVVQNHEAMSTTVVFKVDFFSYHRQSSPISLYYIVPISFVCGLLVAGVYGVIERFRLQKTIKMLKNESQEKNQELNSLRILPITSDEVTSGDLEEP